jgi:hypothetical protein
MPRDRYLDTDEDEYENEIEMSEGDSDDASDDGDAPEIDDPNDPNPGDEITSFGRYSGKKFDEVPSSYVDWVMKEIRKNPQNPSPNVR